MKKVVAFAMAGMLAFSCASVSYAEEEVQSFDYSMIDPDVYEGTWVSAMNVLDLYLPNDWEYVYDGESGEAPEKDVLFAVQSPDASRCLRIAYLETDLQDLYEMEERLHERDVEEEKIVVLNDIPGVLYTSTEDGEVTIAFAMFTDDGGIYNVYTLSAEGDDEYNEVAQNIFCSISITETEEVETEN